MLRRDEQFDRIRLAASLYYLDGLSQTEVARILEVSQAKVSRLLQLARDKGVVRITIDEHQPRQTQLEEDLCAVYGLNSAVVIRNLSDASLAGVRRNVGYFGASAVAEMVRSGGVIGVTGGRTLAELVRRIKAPKRVRELRIVQLMGSIGAAVDDADAVELSRHLAAAFGGSFYALNMPAFASSRASRDTFLKQEQAEAVWKLYDEMTLALVGIGSLKESAFIDRGVLSTGDLLRLGKAGAVGEICGRFYDAAGKECRTDYRQRVVSIELEQLRQIPQVVAVTTGAARANAAAVAVQSGLVKSLVVDEQCALAVLAKSARRPRKARGTKLVAGV